MTGKQTYWIADPNGGTKALVEGADQRDLWTKARGWDETTEPVPGERVWAYNPNSGGRATLPHEALTSDGYWHSVGFVPAEPPEPVNLTQDPALRDQPATTTADTSPAEPENAPAAGGKQNKESSRG